MNEDRQRLLTSTEAAEYLGASPTSIKRWADDGLLPCVRTAGKHRRFTVDSLERFARDQMGAQLEAPTPEDLDEWVADLLEGRPYRLQARLFDARSSVPSWRAVCRRVMRVIDHLGASREQGRITVVEEDLAAERLARALARIAETLPVGPAAPRALVVTLEGEDHALTSSLLEICLRELGWQALWSGRRTPLAGLGEALDRQQIRLLAVSAVQASSDAISLGRAAETLALICRPRSITLWLVGRGSWPERPPYGRVVHELDEIPSALPNF